MGARVHWGTGAHQGPTVCCVRWSSIRSTKCINSIGAIFGVNSHRVEKSLYLRLLSIQDTSKLKRGTTSGSINSNGATRPAVEGAWSAIKTKVRLAQGLHKVQKWGGETITTTSTAIFTHCPPWQGRSPTPQPHQHHCQKDKVRQAGTGLTQVAAVKGRLQEKALNHSKTYSWPALEWLLLARLLVWIFFFVSLSPATNLFLYFLCYNDSNFYLTSLWMASAC